MAELKQLSSAELSALVARFSAPQGAAGASAQPEVKSRADGSDLPAALKKDSAAAQQPSAAAKPSFADFSAYRQLKVQLKVAASTGIAVPYFMLHQGLAKDLTEVDGRQLLNFSTYDYLGLNGDVRVNAAAAAAAERYGTSASASRLVAGERPVHRELEQALAQHYQTDDCVAMVSGYAANVTTIASLFGPQDVIFADELCHNSIMTGAKDSRAVRLIYPHNDMAALRQLLISNRSRHKRALIVTEGVFSMDGNIAPLSELTELKEEFNAFLMVDEAHALGCIGSTGAGSFEYAGIDPRRVDIWMGTLSKTLCTCGGFIAGEKALIELLKYKAPGFVYSVGLSPVLAAASLKALDLMHTESWRTQRLQENGKFALECARSLGLNTGLAEGTEILPVVVGSSMRAAFLSNLLLDAGVCVLPIIYPVVSEGAARLRFFLSASHSKEQIAHALELTAKLLPQARAREAQFVTKVQSDGSDPAQSSAAVKEGADD